MSQSTLTAVADTVESRAVASRDRTDSRSKVEVSYRVHRDNRSYCRGYVGLWVRRGQPRQRFPRPSSVRSATFVAHCVCCQF
jgi:hypothetical protein